MQKLFVLAGALLIAGGAVLCAAYGATFGNLIAFAAGGLLIALGLLFGRLPRCIQMAVKVLTAAGCLFFLVTVSIIIVGGARSADTFDEDCVIVLGCGIRGEELLPTLKSRLDKCIAYLARNPDVPVVVSGGQGHNESISEGEAMRRYLVANGIDNTRVIVEDKARDTRQNFQYSKQLLDSRFDGMEYSAACITSDYHIYRSRLIAQRNAIEANFYPSGVVWYLRPAAYCREVLSVCLAWIRNK